MHEGAVSELPHRMLANTGKERITQLVEAELKDAHQVIGNHQHDWRSQHARQPFRQRAIPVQ